MSGPEGKIEQAFARYCRTRGVLCLKLEVASQAGFPDRTVIGPGFVFFVEFKRDMRCQPSGRQEWWIHELKQRGQAAFVCYSLKDAVEVLESYL